MENVTGNGDERRDDDAKDDTWDFISGALRADASAPA